MIAVHLSAMFSYVCGAVLVMIYVTGAHVPSMGVFMAGFATALFGVALGIVMSSLEMSRDVGD